MDKVYYYSRMKKISITKPSSDIDNKELLPVSLSSSLKVWSLSQGENEEGYNVDIDDTKSKDSDILEILSYLVHSLFQKRQFHINTDFAVTRWMLCVIPHISKDAKDNLDSDHWKQVNDEIIKLIQI